MDVLLRIQEPVSLEFCRKIGEDRVKNLLSEFIRVYAETCVSADNIVETAIIESRKEICSRLLTRDDLKSVVAEQLSGISTVRDIDKLVRIADSNMKTVEVMASRNLGRIQEIVLGQMDSLNVAKSNIVLEFSRLLREGVSDLLTPIKDFVVREFGRVMGGVVNKSDVELLRNQVVSDMERLGGFDKTGLVGLKDLTDFRLDLLREMAMVTMKTDWPVGEFQKIGKIQEELGEVRRTVERLGEVFSKNSQRRGERMENVFEELLNSSFPSAEIERTSGKSKAGDFIISLDGGRFLLDVKNYTNNVPVKEIEKLKRDVLENKVEAGIMISMGSGISSVEKIGIRMAGKVPVILLPNNGTDMEMLRFAINLARAVRMPDATMDRAEVDAMLVDVRAILMDFDRSIDLIRKTRDRVLARLEIGRVVDERPEEYVCGGCKKLFRTRAGLMSHEKHRH